VRRALLLSFAAACSSVSPPDPPAPIPVTIAEEPVAAPSAVVAPVAPACERRVVSLRLYSDDTLNAHDQGHPRPVVVRLYQLRGDARLDQAKYDDVLLRDGDALGDELVKRHEVIVYPNELVEVRLALAPDAKHIAAVALFHAPRAWRAFYALSAACDEATSFFLEGVRIDDGGALDESMFPTTTPTRNISIE
jgi:type VI secretion system protein VasD